MKRSEDSAFGSRLREAFGNASNTQIAERLSVSKATITNYMAGKIPPPETLIEISKMTEFSIDWLLTGDGTKYLMKYTQEQKEGLEYLKTLGALASKEESMEHCLVIALTPWIEEALNKRAHREGAIPEIMVFNSLVKDLIASGDLPDHSEGARSLLQDTPLSLVSLSGEITPEGVIKLLADDALKVKVPEWFAKTYRRDLFVIRVHGRSLAEDGIPGGYLLIGQRLDEIPEGKLALVLIDGKKAAVGRYYRRGVRIGLQPANVYSKPTVLLFERVTPIGMILDQWPEAFIP